MKVGTSSRVWRRVGSPALVAVLATSGCGEDVVVAPKSLPALAVDGPTGGSRLDVEQWRSGSLTLFRRFLDTALGFPCAVATLGDTTACVPIQFVSPSIVAFADEECGTFAMWDSPELAGAFAEGDWLTWWAWPIAGVYRVGPPIADGALYSSSDQCATAPATPFASGARRALTPVSNDELVRFERETIPAMDGIEVDVLRGEDGSVTVGEARMTREFLGDSGIPCQILGDRCVPGLGPQVYPFQRAFTDGQCTEDAFYQQYECSPSGELHIAVDECGRQTPLGLSGAPSEAAGYRRSAEGACVASPPVGEPGAACLQTLDPSPLEALPRFTEQRTTEDGLTLVQLFAGNIRVAAHFELAGEQRCDAAWTADGEIRCVPLDPVMLATTTDGAAGYTTVDACAGETGAGESVYTFVAGAPCNWTAVREPEEGFPEDELHRYGWIGGLVPWDGPVYELRVDVNGQPTCSAQQGGGGSIAVERPPASLPALVREVE